MENPDPKDRSRIVKGQKFLLIGRIVKPHGIRGELGVISLTEWPDLRFQPGAELFIGPDEKSLSETVIDSVRPYRQGYLVLLDICPDRSAAEALRGWNLYISSSEAPEPSPGSYYHHELLGLAVRDEAGNELGRVSAILDTPAHDLLEVETRVRKKFLLPMVDEFILEVDLKQGALYVHLPEGLTDI
ncbi:MAG: ribosome maturation factor RimM [Gemmatimonadota bacterium]|nr:ribosome maturation factor RimM [Gemmatimonadota bacterium]